MYDPINNNIYYSRDVTWMKRMYFPKVDALGIRIDWLSERINNFISGQRYSKKKQRRRRRQIAPANEAGRNGDVTSVADDDDDNDAESENQRNYGNTIDPEVIDSDVSMNGENVNDDGDDDDQYYDASDTSDDEGMDEDGNNVTEDEDTFEDASEDEADDDDSNELNDDQPEQQHTRTTRGRVSRPYDHDMKAGSRTMSKMDDREISGLLLFMDDYTPIETQFFHSMTELGEYEYLNASMPSYPCGRAELQLVGATGTQYKNTKDLATKNYNEMMESPHKGEYIKGIDVEHEKFVKFNCLEETLKKALKPGDKIIDGTWVGKFKAS